MTEKFYKSVAIPAEVLMNGDKDEIAKYGKQLMTPEEIKEHKLMIAKHADRLKEIDPIAARKAAYEKHWPDTFALIDDILTRGASVVKAERAAIKAKFPKKG